MEMILLELSKAYIGRHKFGSRISQECSPVCPSCEKPMFCIFSLDPSDSAISDFWVSKFRVADFFVCACCSMYLDTYWVKLNDPVRIFWQGIKKQIVENPVLPFPAGGIKLTKKKIELSQEVLEQMEFRELWNRKYHMIVGEKLWGIRSKHGLNFCPECNSKLVGIAVIDSDDSIGFLQEVVPGKIGKISLNWVDDYYLHVTGCIDCQIMLYTPVHG